MAKPQVINHDFSDGFDRDPERSSTLAAPYYFDPAVYEKEKETIFYRSWNFVCHVEQVRDIGGYATAMVADQNIFVIRGKDRVLRGFYNVCQHRAHELLKGSGKRKVIACPYHGWTYETDGRLKNARNSQDLPGFNPGEFGLKPVQVEEFSHFIFINLDPGAPSLNSQTGELQAEIRSYVPHLDKLIHALRLRYDLATNWKNAIDNFLECYHCRIAHPAFADLIDMPTYRSKTHGIYSSHTARSGPGDNKAYTFEKSDDDLDFGAWWLWPNVNFIVNPGESNVVVMHMMPSGPETTIEHLDFYFLTEKLDEQQRAVIEYFDKVLNPEDIGLVESVQRGLHSRGYHQSRYIVDRDRTELSEHAVHHFHSLVLGALKG